MRFMRHILLTFLATLPIASISMAAYSQLNELAGEDQSDLLRFQVTQARRLLFRNGVLTTTVQEARERFAYETGITDEQVLEEEFNRQMQILIENGLVETDERLVMAGTPSAW